MESQCQLFQQFFADAYALRIALLGSDWGEHVSAELERFLQFDFGEYFPHIGGALVVEEKYRMLARGYITIETEK